MNMNISNGQKVRDTISGFAGTVTGIAEYITGCRQMLVQPELKENGDFTDPRWFDEDRLEKLDSKPISLEIKTAGPDIPAPRK